MSTFNNKGFFLQILPGKSENGPFCNFCQVNLEMVTINQQGFLPLYTRKSGNGHFQLAGLFAILHCQKSRLATKAGIVTAEGIPSFEAIKWRMATLNRKCLCILILQMATFNQQCIFAGWELQNHKMPQLTWVVFLDVDKQQAGMHLATFIRWPNIAGVNQYACINWLLVYCTCELVLANQRTHESSNQSFNGVGGASQACVWAVWQCFQPRHFHSRVEVQHKATCPTVGPTPTPETVIELGTSSEPPNDDAQTSLPKEVDFIVCTKGAALIVKISSYGKICCICNIT